LTRDGNVWMNNSKSGREDKFITCLEIARKAKQVKTL
jgi:hypothetical protein